MSACMWQCTYNCAHDIVQPRQQQYTTTNKLIEILIFKNLIKYHIFSDHQKVILCIYFQIIYQLLHSFSFSTCCILMLPETVCSTVTTSFYVDDSLVLFTEDFSLVDFSGGFLKKNVMSSCIMMKVYLCPL